MLITARHLVLVVGLGLFSVSPSLASAAEGGFGETGSAIAHLSHVEGTVTRLHRFAPAPAGVGVALVERDQIVTAVGRAEVTFADGSVMHLDQHTQVVISGGSRVRLLDGRVSLRTTTTYTVETVSGVHVLSASARSSSSELRRDLYELTASANNRDVLVRVVEGQAQIESPWGVESVTSTQTAFVSGPTGRPFVSGYHHVQNDAFVQWSNSSLALVSSAYARSEAGELRRDLAIATFGREGGPPFVPYAHPAYRQFAYGRLLRDGRHDRKRPEFHHRADVGRDAPQRNNAPVQRRASRATSDEDRRRSDRQAPSAKGAAPAARGAGKGAAVRRP